MRLRAPTTPSCCGVEPAFHLDMLSSDELAGQGVSLYPAATPPSVNRGLVLNGTTQYARCRAGFLLPQQFTFYVEFTPTFNYDNNSVFTFLYGDAAAQGWFFKNNNANLNRLFFLVGAGSIYVNGADYGALWVQNGRNRIAVRATTGASVMYLNGIALATVSVAWTSSPSNYYFVGADATPGTYFPGTIYDVQIYTRLLTAAEAIQLTTVT